MITYEEDQLPVTQVLVTVDDVSREGGGQEPHDVGEAVGNPEQSSSKVGRHVKMCAHKPWIYIYYKIQNLQKESEYDKENNIDKVTFKKCSLKNFAC